MRNVLYASIAILLTAVLFSCEIQPIDDNTEPVRYTPDGVRMFKVAVNAGQSAQPGRALHQGITEAILNYYEVGFRDGTNYYRVAGRFRDTLYLWLPEDFTANAQQVRDNSLVLAGYRRNAPSSGSQAAELTLLATGICTGTYEIDDDITLPPTGVTVNSNTGALRFEIVALETKVAISDTSGFRITGGGGPGPAPANSVTTTTNGNFGRMIIESGAIVPYFKVPAETGGSTYNIRARMIVEGLMTHSMGRQAMSNMYVMETNPSVDLTRFVWGGDPLWITGFVEKSEGLIAPSDYTDVTITPPFHPSAQIPTLPWTTTVADQWGFKIQLNTNIDTSGVVPHPQEGTDVSWKDGWALLALNIPIRMFDAVNAHDQWYIRTGMYNYRPDTGYDDMSLNGGILLQVGAPVQSPQFW